MARALTTKSVENQKPDPKRRQEIADPALSGLYLVIQPSGSKSWALRYRFAGKPKKLTLGKWPIMGVADARSAASDAIEQIDYGKDPSAIKRATKAAQLEAQISERDKIKTLIEQYDKRHLSTLKSRASAKQFLDRFVVLAWGELDVHEITKRDVVDLLDEICDSGRETTANRVLAHTRKFFNWCVERDVIEYAPTTGVKAPLKEQHRKRVLNDDEIRWFWAACEAVREPWGKFGKMLLLTSQRLNEVAQMTEGEVKGDLWHLDSGRTKNGLSHDVPLSEGALRVLASVEMIEGKPGYVFTTNGETPVSGFHKARNYIADQMTVLASEERGEEEEIPHWTFHDLRRTAETGMARLRVPQEHIDRVTNHVTGQHRMARVYNQYDYLEEKRGALEAWSRLVADIAEGGAANVVQLGVIK
ncbi:Site-specific recombinase XerD [Shimia gijangensis]|uniref:Site-specific recombinase XerD n=1 Tax=Shimia gijangensis TaxID=1470563 RepID=A0A1M6HCA5_9RHOB|nr:site-specific integrase [Shimia gijangensis]SHJ19811.1 Site-specific recombinase XerD [Shimia gijangensis]